MEPKLERMLKEADAALIIGDPALRITPERLELEYLDLGAEWFRLTGLPMVFAAWAGKPGIPIEFLSDIASRSYAFGKSRIDEIIELSSLVTLQTVQNSAFVLRNRRLVK